LFEPCDLLFTHSSASINLPMSKGLGVGHKWSGFVRVIKATVLHFPELALTHHSHVALMRFGSLTNESNNIL